MTPRSSLATLSHAATWKIGFVTLIYLDLLLTLFATQHGFTEMNPFMARLLSRPGELYLVKVVVPLCIVWVVPAKLLLPSIGFMLFVVGWNVKEILALV